MWIYHLKSLGDLQVQIGQLDESVHSYSSAVRMFNNGSNSSGDDDDDDDCDDFGGAGNLLHLEPNDHILGLSGVLLDLSSISSSPAAAAA